MSELVITETASVSRTNGFTVQHALYTLRGVYLPRKAYTLYHHCTNGTQTFAVLTVSWVWLSTTRLVTGYQCGLLDGWQPSWIALNCILVLFELSYM